MQFVFPEHHLNFSSVLVDERFTNKVQFDTGFAHHLKLKDGAVPAIKDPSHYSELQIVSEMASTVESIKTSHKKKKYPLPFSISSSFSLSFYPSLASLYLFEQCLRLGVRCTSSVCLPLQD